MEQLLTPTLGCRDNGRQADGAEIRDVQDQLLAVERAMIVTGDPSAPMFSALAAFAGELHRSYLIGEAQRQALAETVQSLVLPAAKISDEQVEHVAQRVARILEPGLIVLRGQRSSMQHRSVSRPC